MRLDEDLGPERTGPRVYLVKRFDDEPEEEAIPVASVGRSFLCPVFLRLPGVKE